MATNKDFYGEFEKKSEKGQNKNFDLQTADFGNFSAHHLNYYGRLGWQDQIKTTI